MLGAGRFFQRIRSSGATLSPSRMLKTSYTKVAGGTEDVAVFLPEGYDSSLNQYPVLYFFGGDGSDGTFTNVLGQSVPNISGNQYGATLTNTGSRKVFYPSIILYVNGVEVGRAYPKKDGSDTCELRRTGGAIDLTGTVTVDIVNAGLSVTFDSALPGGAAVTVDYSHSAVFEAGIPRMLNRGTYDLPCIVIIVQKAGNNTEYVTADHWDDVLDNLEGTYRVKTNQRYVCGISRGTFHTGRLFRDRYADIAAVICCAGNLPSSIVWTNVSTIGNLWVNGSSESNTDGITPPFNTITNSSSGNATGNTYEQSPQTLMLEGLAHVTAVWDTNCYNRLTAPFDFWEFLRRFSKDQDERCTLHVDWAEENPHYLTYREALRVVNLLSAGATKTALLARLADLRTLILGTKRVWILDFGTTTALAGEGAVSQNNASTGSVKASMVDDLGAASGVGFTIVQEMSTTPTSPVRVVDASNNAGKYHGLGISVNRDGARLEPAVTNGSVKWTGLDTLKEYDQIIISHCPVTSTTTFHTEFPKISVQPAGESAKTMYSAYNYFLHLEHTGIIPNGSGEIVSAISNPGNFNSFLNYVILIG